MMRGRIVVLLGAFMLAVTQAQAAIIISEVLADPAAGIAGDANADGVRSSSDDEFVEFFNNSATAIDVSGWTLADGVGTRHVFGVNSFIEAQEYLVVFGGGDPQLAGVNWQVATTGGLGLNNGGDVVALSDLDNAIVDQVIYDGLASNDQSITIKSLTDPTLIEHTAVSQELFSPGTSHLPKAASTVPEPATLSLLLLGAPWLLGIRRRK